jgi:hypothetical protein
MTLDTTILPLHIVEFYFLGFDSLLLYLEPIIIATIVSFAFYSVL